MFTWTHWLQLALLERRDKMGKATTLLICILGGTEFESSPEYRLSWAEKSGRMLCDSLLTGHQTLKVVQSKVPTQNKLRNRRSKNMTSIQQQISCALMLLITSVIRWTVPRNSSSRCLFYILYIFVATCFGPCWPSSGGMHNNFRKLLHSQRIRGNLSKFGQFTDAYK
jgi:hypothetical protein